MTKRTRWIALVALTLALLLPAALLQAEPAAQPTNGATPTVTAPPAAPAANTPSGNEGKKEDNAAGNGGNAGGAGNTSTTRPAPGLLDGNWPLIAVFGAFLLIMWFSSRNRKKQEQQRRDMLANLKKGDKITTTSGIIGTLIEVREDEIVLKVDDTNNVRMRFLRGAIMSVGDKPVEQKK